MSDAFGPIRLAAVEKWQADSSRDCSSVTECYDESYECRWQYRATDDGTFSHISIFCSLADWSCNISDTLTDARYDGLDLSNPDDLDTLARFYTRFLMVVAEVFSDLEAIMDACTAKRDARDRLSATKGWINQFHCFVNRACKHKFKNLHVCNHHLPLCFDDLSTPCGYSNPICIGHVDIENADAVQFPALSDVTDAIIHAYKTIDALFDDEPAAFKRLCTKFDETTSTSSPA
jgi:hypothetical protein